MKKINIQNIEYKIIRDDNCINEAELNEKVTDYFTEYDYIFGDYAYNKLRLKGFNNKEKANKVNNIEDLEDYIDNYCSYGSKVFLLKKN